MRITVKYELNFHCLSLSSPDEPLKWQFVDQFVSESGVSLISKNLHIFINPSYVVIQSLLLTRRRRRPVLLAWPQSEERRSRRKKCFSAWLAPKAWASGETECSVFPVILALFQGHYEDVEEL